MACASEPLTALHGAPTDPACMFTADGGAQSSVMAPLHPVLTMKPKDGPTFIRQRVKVGLQVSLKRGMS